MNHHTDTTNEKAPGAINTEGLATDTTKLLNSATGEHSGKAIHLSVAMAWRNDFARGNPVFRKYGDYSELSSGRRARRALARQLAKAARKAGKA